MFRTGDPPHISLRQDDPPPRGWEGEEPLPQKLSSLDSEKGIHTPTAELPQA